MLCRCARTARAHWRSLALHLFLLAIRLTNYHTFLYVQQCPPKKFLCFAMTSLRGCVAAACVSLALAQDEYLITSLPGWGGKQTMYSGYINVSSQRNLFFWLVESSNPSADLVMWTNGGDFLLHWMSARPAEVAHRPFINDPVSSLSSCRPRLLLPLGRAFQRAGPLPLLSRRHAEAQPVVVGLGGAHAFRRTASRRGLFLLGERFGLHGRGCACSG